ncbi:MAG: hypothetical protein ABIR81_07510 [Ginsengibacter sp.]
MKKLVTAIIAVLYLGLSSGFAVNVHYCMGKKAGAEVEISKSGKCGKCGMAAKPGCCQDQVTVVKINDSHKANYNSYSFQSAFYLLSKNYSFLQAKHFLSKDQLPVSSSSPLQGTYPSLYLLHNVFRI